MLYDALVDAHRLSSKIKSELPGRGKEVEKDAEKYGKQAGAKIDSAVCVSPISARHPSYTPFSWLTCSLPPH